MVKCDYCQKEVDHWLALRLGIKPGWYVFCSLECLEKWARDQVLIKLRERGKTLRQIAKRVSLSYQAVRLSLLKYGFGSELTRFTTQTWLARMLGVSPKTLIAKRRGYLLNPTRLYGRWLYSDDEITKAKALFERHCAGCGAILLSHRMKWCLECKPSSSSRPLYRYWTAEQKNRHSENVMRCRKKRREVKR